MKFLAPFTLSFLTLSGCAQGSGMIGGTGGSGGSPTSSSSSTVTPCTADTTSDPENCGACGHSCLGGACTMGACQPVQIAVTDPAYQTPRWVGADHDTIYYVSGGMILGDAAFFSVDRHGGTPTKLAPFGWDQGSWIYPTTDKVWVFTGACCSGGNVYAWDKKQQMLDESGGAIGADQIIDAWLGKDLAFFATDTFVSFNAPANNGNPGRFLNSFGTNYGGKVTGNSHSVFFTANGMIYKAEQSALTAGKDTNGDVFSTTGASYMAATEDSLFVAGTDTIQRLDFAGGAPFLLAAGASIAELRADTENVYWADESTSIGKVRIMTVPSAGGPTRLVAEVDGTLGGLWLDDVGLLWSTYEPAAIWQVAR